MAYPTDQNNFLGATPVHWQNQSIAYSDTMNMDAFGRLRVSNPNILLENQHQYNTSPLLWDQALVGGGTVTFLPNESSVQLNVGTASGDKVTRQTHEYFRYQPGRSQFIMVTALFGPSKTNVRSRIGYHDDNNGMYFERISTGVSVNIRSFTSGAVVNTSVPQASWNVDPLNGTGPSGININWDLKQLFFIDFQWLGTGRVRFGIIDNGLYYICHEFEFGNLLTVPYTTTANLPCRVTIENLGTTATASSMKQTCISVMSEGGVAEESGIPYSTSNGIVKKAITGRMPVLAIRLAPTFNGVVNRAHLQLLTATIITDANVFVELAYGSAGIDPTTLTAPVWTSVATNSIAQFDISATAVSGGEIVTSGYVNVTGAGTNAVGAAAIDIKNERIVTNSMDGTTPDIVTIVCTPFSGTANVSASISWLEQYL